MSAIFRVAWGRARNTAAGECGFTLIEAMIAISLLTFGLLAIAGVFPNALALGEYAKDETKATELAQQEMEFIKYQATSWIPTYVGDYASGSAVPTAYFTSSEVTTTSSTAYFTRDVQIQYWLWSGSGCGGAGCFVISSTPYTAPASTPYVYRVSVATHWLVNGQTAFIRGHSVNGCLNGVTAVAVARGCIAMSTFIHP
jgi:Tfp pilus assembly protein PilV